MNPWWLSRGACSKRTIRTKARFSRTRWRLLASSISSLPSKSPFTSKSRQVDALPVWTYALHALAIPQRGGGLRCLPRASDGAPDSSDCARDWHASRDNHSAAGCAVSTAASRPQPADVGLHTRERIREAVSGHCLLVMCSFGLGWLLTVMQVVFTSRAYDEPQPPKPEE
jgi:hypothetical protein